MIGYIKFAIQKIFYVRLFYVYRKQASKDIKISKNIEIDSSYSTNIIQDKNTFNQLLNNGFSFDGYPNDQDINIGLDSGGILIAIFYEKRIAHTSWLTNQDQSAIFDSIFKSSAFAGKNFGYIGPCNTYNNHKGKRLYPYALQKACHLLLEFGNEAVLINTKKNNIPSIKGIIRAGFKPFVKVYKFRIFGLSKNILSKL